MDDPVAGWRLLLKADDRQGDVFRENLQTAHRLAGKASEIACVLPRAVLDLHDADDAAADLQRDAEKGTAHRIRREVDGIVLTLVMAMRRELLIVRGAE